MSVPAASAVKSQNFYYTNKIVPNSKDTTSNRVYKLALIIFTLGSIFVVTLGIDLTSKILKGYSTKKIDEPVFVKSDNLLYTCFNKAWNVMKMGFNGIAEFFSNVDYLSQLGTGLKEGTIHLFTIPYKYANTTSATDKCEAIGYIAGSYLTFAVGDYLGLKGRTTALALGLFGIGYTPFKQYAWPRITEYVQTIRK